MSARFVSRLQVFASAALFSTGGAAIKACSLVGWQVACLRSGIAAAALVLLIPVVRREKWWRPPVVLVAASYAATMILFVLGNKLTTAANTIFLQATAPIYVLVLSPFLLGERAKLREIGIMAAMAAGMAMFFVGIPEPTATAPDPLRGNFAALGAGFCYGLTLIGLRWLGREKGESRGSGITAVALGNLLAFLFALPFAWPFVSVTFPDLLSVSYLGVAQIGFAYLLLTSGMKRLSALEVALLLMAEPVLNPLWAWLVQGEVPGPWALAGGAVILLATLSLTLLRESSATAR